MAKLKLDLEHLRVEAFVTETSGTEKGTVAGAQISAYTGCTCPPYSAEEGCSDNCTVTCIPTGGRPSCFKCPHEN